MQYSTYYSAACALFLSLISCLSLAQSSTVEIPNALASYDSGVTISVGSAGFKLAQKGKLTLPVKVTKAGLFRLNFRAKNISTADGTFRITFQNRILADVGVPVQDYQWVNFDSDFSLTTGEYQLLIEGNSPGIYLDKVQFVSGNGGLVEAILNLQQKVDNNAADFVSPIDSAPVFSQTINLVNNGLPLQDNIISALRIATPGTKINIPDGIYINPDLNMERAYCPNGLPNKPIVIQAANPGKVTFIGNQFGIDLCGSYIVLKGIKFRRTDSYEPLYDKIIRVGIDEDDGVLKACDYCALRQLSFDNFSPANKLVKSFWVYVPQTKDATGTPTRTSMNLEISDSVFQNKTNIGPIIYMTMAQASGNHRIYRNYFSRTELGVDSYGVPLNEGETIRMGDSQSSGFDSNTIIENNLFNDASGDYEIISVKSNKNIIRYNTFVNSKGSISIRAGHSNIIEGNYILGQHRAGSGGIRLSGKFNIVIANHIQETDFATVAQFYPITFMSGENKACTGSVYCPVESNTIAGNYVTNNSAQFALNATYNATSRPVLIKTSLMAYNIFTFQEPNDILFKDYANSRFAGLTSLSNFYSGSYLSFLNFEPMETDEMLINDKLLYPTDSRALDVLKISAEKMASIPNNQSILITDDKNIYEMSLPLSNTDVGQYMAKY